MKKYWTWFLSFFKDVHKDKVVELIDGIKNIIESAVPLVAIIDEKLKPYLDTDTKYYLLVKFLKEQAPSLDKLADVAAALSRLPTPEMLANLAMVLVQCTTPVGVSGSTLRLAVEIAYSIYKMSKTSKTV